MIQEPTKAFLKAFPTKMKPTKCPAKEKNEARKAKKEVGEKARSKSKTALSLLTPPPPQKFCFLRMPEHRKLILFI